MITITYALQYPRVVHNDLGVQWTSQLQEDHNAIVRPKGSSDIVDIDYSFFLFAIGLNIYRLSYSPAEGPKGGPPVVVSTFNIVELRRGAKAETILLASYTLPA